MTLTLSDALRLLLVSLLLNLALGLWLHRLRPEIELHGLRQQLKQMGRVSGWEKAAVLQRQVDAYKELTRVMEHQVRTVKAEARAHSLRAAFLEAELQEARKRGG